MRILIPVDGSELSMRAVDHAARFVREGEIVLFHAAAIPPRLLEHGGGRTNEEERALEHDIGEGSRRYREEIGPRIECEIFGPAKERLLRGKHGQLNVTTMLATEASSEPAVAILAEADGGTYDAVVIGRHGRSGILRFFLGGTAAKLVHHLQTTAIWLVP